MRGGGACRSFSDQISSSKPPASVIERHMKSTSVACRVGRSHGVGRSQGVRMVLQRTAVTRTEQSPRAENSQSRDAHWWRRQHAPVAWTARRFVAACGKDRGVAWGCRLCWCGAVWGGAYDGSPART